MIRTGFSEQRRASSITRAGALLLAAGALYPGIWATFWPRSFFLDFPGGGQRWVAVFPPYNEHLVRDIGSFYLAFGVLLGVAALRGDRKIARGALFAWVVFSIPHLVFHATHVGGRGTVQRWGSVVAIGASLLLALVLLVVERRRQ